MFNRFKLEKYFCAQMKHQTFFRLNTYQSPHTLIYLFFLILLSFNGFPRKSKVMRCSLLISSYSFVVIVEALFVGAKIRVAVWTVMVGVSTRIRAIWNASK